MQLAPVALAREIAALVSLSYRAQGGIGQPSREVDIGPRL